MSDNAIATDHITTPGAYTNSPVYEIAGTASGFSFPGINTYDNGVLDGGSVVENGTWSSLVVLTPGDNVITAGPEVESGAPSDNAIDLVYEPSLYQPAYGNPLNVTVDQAGGNTNSATQVLSGAVSSAEFGTRLVAGTTLTLSDDGTVLGHAMVGIDGTWNAEVTLPNAGANEVMVSDLDLAGNTGEAVTYFDLKTSVPSVAITSGGGAVSQPLQVISGVATAGDVGDIVTLSEDGAAVGTASVGADGCWSVVTTLGAGSHVFQATDADLYGNTSTSNTVAYTLNSAPAPTPPDTTPPAVAFGAPPQLSGTSATLAGTASDASGIAGIEIYDGATDLGAAQVAADGTWTFTRDFGQAVYDQLTAVATDAAGNNASASALYDLDTVPFGRRSAGEVTTLDSSGAVTSCTTISVDGAIGAQTMSNGDGTATSTGYENGQSLFSIGDDVMTGNGYREDFVFQPTMGHARITDFVVDGPLHDTITLSHQDFANVAQVLNSTTMNHGSAVIHVSPDDTIRLVGVTRADLAQHRGDFAFTD